jgi:quinohemoprotein ethanol dehydrogenase
MIRRFRLLALVSALAGCDVAVPPDTGEQVPPGLQSDNRSAPGRNDAGQYHSPLRSINVDNVHRLGLAWEYDARPRRGRTPRGLQATPVVMEGVMYTSAAWGVVFALDARTGAELWRFDPDLDGAWGRRACCDVVNRGVQVGHGMVYVGTLDGYLVALDAGSGDVVWRVDTIIDRQRFYTITGAPQLAGDRIVIGNSGGEFGVRGYISAWDARTGEFAWRFFTVPGDPAGGFEHPEMELAAETWDPDSDWAAGGGGTVWGWMAYDPELHLLYAGTGNASPYPIWFRSPRGGDNLFLASILAIDPDSGRMAWHYQTTPGESWDFTATQNLILADLEIGGATRKVLMQAPKNGFFYVLDRASGELLSAEPFVTVTWASHVDLRSGRPVVTGQGDYRFEPKLVFPAMPGGHNWQPMAYSPGTGLVYIPAIDVPMVYRSDSDYEYRPGEFNLGATGRFPPFPDSWQRYTAGQPPAEAWKEYLLAWDPVAARAAWRVELESEYNGGVLVTDGGLVFQGTSSGYLFIYRADTGEQLHALEIGTGVMAPPMAYQVGGEQYVAVMAGFGGALLSSYPRGSAALRYENHGRLLVFRLDGGPVPLPPVRVLPDIPEPPDKATDREQIATGGALYARHCARCHGATNRDNAAGFPNLVWMNRDMHEVFRAIVLDGMLSYGGMAGFADVLSAEDADAIQAYIIDRQHELRADPGE